MALCMARRFGAVPLSFGPLRRGPGARSPRVPGEPILRSSPAQHLMVLGAAALVASGLAPAVTHALGGSARGSGLAAGITALAWIPSLLPAALGRQTVPSRYGSAVLFGSMGHTLATLALGLLTILAVEVERRPFMAGLIAGAFVLLSAQVARAIWVLRQASPTSAEGR